MTDGQQHAAPPLTRREIRERERQAEEQALAQATALAQAAGQQSGLDSQPAVPHKQAVADAPTQFLPPVQLAPSPDSLGAVSQDRSSEGKPVEGRPVNESALPGQPPLTRAALRTRASLRASQNAASDSASDTTASDSQPLAQTQGLADSLGREQVEAPTGQAPTGGLSVSNLAVPAEQLDAGLPSWGQLFDRPVGAANPVSSWPQQQDQPQDQSSVPASVAGDNDAQGQGGQQTQGYAWYIYVILVLVAFALGLLLWQLVNTGGADSAGVAPLTLLRHLQAVAHL